MANGRIGKKLIDFRSYPVENVFEALLKDKTTKQNIIFATDIYENLGIDAKRQLTGELLLGNSFCENIRPRVEKSLEEQAERTKKKAEVFTPSWICNKMNNHCDTEWFGRENVFNYETDKGWKVNGEPVKFETPTGWQKYVDSKRLEITCGEAPYLVSRYDTTTADIIPVKRRIGILDRKLRVVNENTNDEKEWLKWAIRAYQSVYGYEFQGDNLLIARINLLNTFVDYMEDKWNRKPTSEELKKIVNIIVWNLWQMDGITGLVPYGKPKPQYQQLSFFDSVSGEEETGTSVECKIMDWRANKSVLYNTLRGD